MANVLKREKQLEVISLLSEGCSIRSIERHTGVHRDTVMRLLCRFGAAVDGYLDHAFRNVYVEHVQCDEIWTFVAKKEARLNAREKKSGVLGDQYLFTALDTDSKLLFSYALGRRNAETTKAFIADLSQRICLAPGIAHDSPQISTDGFTAYQTAIRDEFGPAVRHGVLIKNYSNPETGRYQPPDMVKADRINIRGIEDLFTICTSHVERCNLTIRTFVRRFTRLCLGFSKKLDNLAAAAALHIGVYNFVRIHQTLNMTPAMAAGVTDTLWNLETFFDVVNDHAKDMKRKAANRRLIERLNRGE
ncbi:MAG: transposase [Planctomycetota bacterium]|nr:transposase [Planctomycetota bacterium]